MPDLTFQSVKEFIQTLDRDQIHELQGLISEGSVRQANKDDDASKDVVSE